MYITHSDTDENCPFAHNNFEILYHPLLLKIKFCREIICRSELDCSFAHKSQSGKKELEIKSGIRLIYPVKSYQTRKIIHTCGNDLDPQVDVTNLKNILNASLPSEFNPFTYKTIECPLGIHCRLESKLCLNYHNLSERRRNCEKFKYDWPNCKFIFRANKYIDPRHCPQGDSCGNSHSIYEFMYHPQNFRTKQCAYEKKGVPCEYIMICPYKHISDCVDFEDKMCYNQTSVDYYKENLMGKISNMVSKVKYLKKIVEYHTCGNCKKDLNGVLNLLRCCNKEIIICQECALNMDTITIKPNICECENSKKIIKTFNLKSN
jgi:hypothetical protein